ncbi:MAG: preprotein translocase subunit SecG [Deferribacterota bacterium]|nr:preprotein translocase subunit SecG [Deferribacterota bacterium]
MFTIILAIHIFVCLLLVLAILIQPSKSSDLSSTLGGGIATDLFGPGAPASIMNKITTILVIIFMLTSISLTILSKGTYESSVINEMQNNKINTQENIPTESK